MNDVYDNQLIKKALAMRLEGLTIREIATNLRVPRSTIWAWTTKSKDKRVKGNVKTRKPREKSAA